MHNVLVILLNRPFVSEGHLYSDSPTVMAEAFAACATAATRIVNLLRVYNHAFSIKRAPYLVSYATYVSATILVRIAAQRKSPRSDAHTNLRTCLSVLEKNQETNWAVRKARKVIIDLADRMRVELKRREKCVEAERVGEGSGSNNGAITSDDGGVVRAAGASLQFSSPPIGNSLSIALQSWDSSQDGSTTILAHEEPASTGPSGELNGLPDIDLDAIIQSFMQDQQTEQGGAGIGGGTAGTTDITERVVHMSPNQFYQSRGGIRAMQLHGQQSQHHQQQQQSYSNVTVPFLRHDQGVNGWAPGSLLTEDLLPEDALFGFNRAGWDGNWWNNQAW